VVDGSVLKLTFYSNGPRPGSRPGNQAKNFHKRSSGGAMASREGGAPASNYPALPASTFSSVESVEVSDDTNSLWVIGCENIGKS
jgi:hypothetical protein